MLAATRLGHYDVPADGGALRALTTAEGGVPHAFPHVLPGGDVALFAKSGRATTGVPRRVALGTLVGER